MHVSTLSLTNIRQFEQRTFEFQPGFNLLVGENGAGKTTILRGLLAVLGGSQQMGKRPKLEDDDIRLKERHAEVIATVRTSDASIKHFHYLKTLWERAKRPLRGSITPLVLIYTSNESTCSAMRVKRTKRIQDSEMRELRRDEEFLYEKDMEFAQRRPDSNERRFGNSRSVREFVSQALSTFSSDFVNFYWRFEPYDCALLAPESDDKKTPLTDEISKQAKAIAMRYFQENLAGLKRVGPFNWPDQAKVLLTPTPPYNDRGNLYLPNLSEIWKEFEISEVGREFLLKCSLEVKLTPRIMIQRKIGALSLSQLSDGEQRLFSLFVDIARQLSLQKPREYIGGGEAIVLIDEIDVHLHPKWQRKIVPALENLFQECQFIATTHSPFVIQATNRKKVTSIDPRTPLAYLDHGNSIEDIAENIQGVEMPQRSIRAENLSKAAEEYFKLMKQRGKQDAAVLSIDLAYAEKKYREASEPFSSDPAVHAFLKVQLMEGNGS